VAVAAAALPVDVSPAVVAAEVDVEAVKAAKADAKVVVAAKWPRRTWWSRRRPRRKPRRECFQRLSPFRDSSR